MKLFDVFLFLTLLFCFVLFFFSNSTGELVLAFQPPASAGQAFGTGKVLVETPPGIYQLKGELQTQPSMSEKFTPGAYLVVGEVCEGTCGSIHAGTKLLSRRNGKFTITQ